MYRQLSAFALSALLMAPAAQAEIMSISAMGFTPQFPLTAGVDYPAAVNGIMMPDGATVMHAPVIFPVNGQNVCAMFLTFDDSNVNEKIFVQLIRKPIVFGSNSEVTQQIMATVNSIGSSGDMRRTFTTAVTPRLINNGGNFYFVKVTAENFNTLLVGVQIDYRPVCP